MSSNLAASTSSAIRTYNLIVFDLDGVVIDSARDLVSAAQYSLRQVRSADPGFDFIRSCIGGGARNLLLRSLDEDKKDRVDEAMHIFRDYYERNCVNATVLYPGVHEVLAYYAGHVKLALATFKIRSATHRILSELGIIKYFDQIVTTDDVRRPKPDPECIQHVLDGLHCPAEDAILVGDTPTDVKTARNAGIASCAVLYGIGTRESLDECHPDFLIANLLELKNIVLL